jgi:hypothetical protein
MDNVRLATAEEVEAIKERANLTPTSTVYALGSGEKLDLAVIRQVVELDPVFFHENSSTERRKLFIWGLENGLRMMGIPEYYFNVHADQERWRAIVEKDGAELTSLAPEVRYKKRLS